MPPDLSAHTDLYLVNRDVIERVIDRVCRRHHLAPTDAEDFASVVRLRLLDNDCAVIRAYQGRSALATYLTAVVTHAYLDWRNSQWGKWRPSAVARRFGPAGILLETMLVRDRCSFDEAVERLRVQHGFGEPRAALEAMATAFPSRIDREQVSESVLETVASPAASAEDDLVNGAAADIARRIRRVLFEAIGQLEPQDRLLLRLHFDDGRSIAEISRVTQLEQKGLYRRLTRILKDLRQSLELAGFDASAAEEVLARHGFDRARADDAPRKDGRMSVSRVDPASGTVKVRAE